MAHNVNYRFQNYDAVYDNVKEILLNDDLTIGNLEFPIDENIPNATYPLFNIHRDYVDAVIRAGVDVFSLANNHSNDQKSEGIYQTLISMIMLKENYNCEIAFSGLRANTKQEFHPISIEKKGFKVGFLAISAISNTRQEKEFINMVNYRNEQSINTFIEYVKQEAPQYDLFIVSCHAGTEYQRTPDKQKAEFYRKIIHAGAHIVYGHHPHVLQPVEIVKVNNLNRLIIHSAGNFISGQRWMPYEPIDINAYYSYTGDSAIFKVQVEKSTQGTTVQSVNLELITNYIDNNKQTIVLTYKDILTRPLPEKWKKYFRARYELMQDFLPAKDITK